MVLADDLSKGVRTVAAVERERGLRALARCRLVERASSWVCSSLGSGSSRRSSTPRFFHALRLCRDGDSPDPVVVIGELPWDVCDPEGRRRIRDVRAADLQEEMANNAFPFSPAPTKTAAAKQTSQRAERAIEHSAMCEQRKNTA